MAYLPLHVSTSVSPVSQHGFPCLTFRSTSPPRLLRVSPPCLSSTSPLRVSPPPLPPPLVSFQVTHFVKPGTELDEEAKRRCTTIYLIQEAIPMLPRLLSETLCSLNEGVDRLAFSCIWNMTPDGKVDYGVPIW